MSNKRLDFWTGRVLSQIDLSPCSGCDSCGIKCATGVQMSRDEYRAVQSYIETAENRDEIAAVTVQDKTLQLGDGITTQMCCYRDMERGGCAVYPARPLVCRLLGHVEWMPCPIDKIKKTAKTADALDLMRSYARVERHTFEEWDILEQGI